MKDSARYAKVIAWSEEDQCYIGYAPGLIFGGCCHGLDEKSVFAELCDIVDEVIETDNVEGMELPSPTAGYHYPGDSLRKAIMAIEPDIAQVR